MKCYARIYDSTGKADGLQGYVTSMQAARNRQELIDGVEGAKEFVKRKPNPDYWNDGVGEEFAHLYVQCPEQNLLNWYFDGKKFHSPDKTETVDMISEG